MEKVKVLENISKVWAEHLVGYDWKSRSDVRASFSSWLKIMNQTPTVFYRSNKTTVYIGLPFEFTHWVCVNPLNHTNNGILKFVCGPPANVTNDNFQV